MASTDEWTIEDQIGLVERDISSMRTLDEHDLDGATVAEALESVIELIKMMRRAE